MTEQLTFCLKLPPKVLSPNYRPASRGGRMGQYAAAKSQKFKTIDAIDQLCCETLPWARCEVSVKFYHKIKRRRDTDNAMGSVKSMYDGIALAGVVADDTPEYMTRKEPAFLADKEQPRIEITIRRIEQ